MEPKMFDKIRNGYKKFCKWDLRFMVVWYVLVAASSALLLVIALFRGDRDQIPSLAGSIVVAVAILWFFHWLVHYDPRPSGEQQHRERPRPRPDGDMSDVAGIGQQPPWMV
jgi:hypothetical protein